MFVSYFVQRSDPSVHSRYAAARDMTDDAIILRRARTRDVRSIRALVDHYVDEQILLQKESVQLYEDIQDFWVADDGGRVVGCGALHPLWEDLAEIRTVAVDPEVRGRGVGHRLVTRLVETARELGVARVLVLTFEVAFFEGHGFAPIEGAPVTPAVYDELRRSFDEGVAEFLDLERVKPNTLGNTRMLLHL